MLELFGLHLTPSQLRERVGSLDQVAGIDRLEYAEGPARGVELLRVRTGGGLEYDVLPGRGMDLARASYHGVPLAWLSPVGVRHAHQYEPAGLGWLRNFFGGLMTTCGLLNAGSPGADPDHDVAASGIGTEDSETVKLGLHGRVNNTPAERVAVSTDWYEDEYLLIASGQVREAVVFGEHVVLERQILSVAGQNTIQVRDTVTNHGFTAVPQMMLYHINLGWPVVSGASTLVTSSRPGLVEPRDEVAAAGLAECCQFEEPRTHYPEQVFYHTIEPDEAGQCQAAIFNPEVAGGLGVALNWSHDSLPNLVQWKSMVRGTYVCGLEPSNCRVAGRAAERAAGTLRFLEPGEAFEYNLSLTVLHGSADWAAFRQMAARGA